MSPLLLALLLQTTPAPACTAVVAPPAGLEAWSATAIGASPATGTPEAFDLKPVADVKFALTPDRAPTPGSFAGVYPLTIAKTGSYRVALSAGAWIDLIDAKGVSLKSVAHTEGPACSGIRKIVDFDLPAGSYTLQLSNAKTAAMRLLVAPK